MLQIHSNIRRFANAKCSSPVFKDCAETARAYAVEGVAETYRMSSS
jgi:hypothetical protein